MRRFLSRLAALEPSIYFHAAAAWDALRRRPRKDHL